VEEIKGIVDFILHIDHYISELINHYGSWTNIILFIIVFCETGLVVTPFLPGDSLLFTVGAFAAKGDFNVWVISSLLIAAGIIGDTVNYALGKFLGPKVFHFEKNKFLKKEYLIKAHKFYEKHGGKTIIIARFVPIIRTFAPFVAGMGSMSYSKFILYNITGAVSWVLLFVFAGYFFGNLPVVKNNFTIVIMGIIVISILPGVYEYIRVKIEKKKGTLEN
jgi:membrane-associated protein